MTHAMQEVSRFTDAELVYGLERLVRADRALSAKLLVHLGEFDERRLFVGRGHGSMFDYCRSALCMSEAEAYLRIHAARVGRRFPLVVERLGAGAVHLSAIKLLSPHLTADNHVQLLDLVRGRTKREIERLLADLAPKPDVQERMRRMPNAPVPAPQESSARPPMAATAKAIAQEAPAAQACAPQAHSAATVTAQPVTRNLPAPQGPATQTHSAVPATAAVQESCASTGAGAEPPRAAAPSVSFALESPREQASCTPLGLGRFKLVLMLGQQAHDDLEQLKELLRHQNPSGDLASIMERALRELRERTMKKRFAKTTAPARRSFRKPIVDAKAKAEAKHKAEGNSRYIPREVLREVHARDAGQCTFVSPEGRRCTERGFLEVHHHQTTFARGGEATVDNLRLTCRTHNRFFADQDYGPGFMRSKLMAARSGE